MSEAFQHPKGIYLKVPRQRVLIPHAARQVAGDGLVVLQARRVCNKVDEQANHLPVLLSCRLLQRVCAAKSWVAVKELKLSYYIGETLLFTLYIYTHYGNLI